MKENQNIQEVTEMVGVTSRTLRYWEQQGLIHSMRDQESNWRVYDNETITQIKFVKELRDLNVSIRNILDILNHLNMDYIKQILIQEMKQCEKDASVSHRQYNQIKQVVDTFPIISSTSKSIQTRFLSIIYSHKKNRRNIMQSELEFITIPKSRVVYKIVVSTTPEEEALDTIMDWLEKEDLFGTATIYGGNMKPFPTSKNTPYGYGVMATIPKDVNVPPSLDEMILNGGKYARMDSEDDIAASWKVFMKQLKEDTSYTFDRSRLCLEQHILKSIEKRQFKIVLLEPVKKK